MKLGNRRATATFKQNLSVIWGGRPRRFPVERRRQKRSYGDPRRVESHWGAGLGVRFVGRERSADARTKTRFFVGVSTTRTG